MNKILYLFIVVLILNGCTMAFKKNLFVDMRNEDIGRHKDLAIHPLSLIEIVPHNVKLDKYICAHNDGCKWAYYVNKETGIIESWKFISSSDKCQTGLGWFKPW